MTMHVKLWCKLKYQNIPSGPILSAESEVNQEVKLNNEDEENLSNSCD